MGFSQQGYWNRLPFPPPGDLANPGIEPMPSVLAGGFFTPESLGRPTLLVPYCKDIVGQRCSIFWHQGLVSMDHDGGNRFRMIQVYYIYCVLYFYYYDISSTSDHQALDPGGWGPLF